MKKSNKLIVKTSLLIGATLGIFGITHADNITLLENNVSSHIQAYIDNPNNILDNVFEKDGMTILPFIFENSDETIKIQDIVSEFDKEGITIQSIDAQDIVTTGTKIKTNNKIYTVLIYGDVDGDGYVDVFDTQSIIRHYVFGGANELKGIYKIAANVDNDDDEIDVFDAQKILRFYVGFETKLVLNKPISIKEQDPNKPVITLNGASTVKINLGDTYIDAGATAIDDVDGDITSKIKVSSNVDISKLGTYFVTYTVSDNAGNTATKTRTVEVVDYLIGIEITNPTKTEYKYGEDLNLSGMSVNTVMKSGSKKPVEISNCTITGYNKNIIGNQTIKVSYNEKNETFDVNVSNYDIDIEIVKLPNNTYYRVGENITIEGMVVNVVKANGDKEQIDDLSKLQINPSIAVLDNNIIKVGYKTINTIDNSEKTFTKTFEISVYKIITQLIVTPNEVEGYRYNTLEIGKVTSGENEEDIVKDDLICEIKKGSQTITDETIAKIETRVDQTDASIIMNFVATQVGTYTVTAKLGEITGNTINITIEENPEVNKITLGEIGEKFRIEQTRIIPIEFAHTYANETQANLEVQAKDITINAVGMEVKLLDEDETEIDVEVTPNAIVKKLAITALAKGTKNLSVTVDSCTENKYITILEKAKTEVKVNGLTDITLYLTSTENEMVKEDDGYIYTIISIYFEDEDGNVTKLKVRDIKQIDEENGKVSIIDNMIDLELDDMPYIYLQGYKTVGNTIEKANNSEEIDYIGIATDSGLAESLRGGYIKISYEGMDNPIRLNVSISE